MDLVCQLDGSPPIAEAVDPTATTTAVRERVDLARERQHHRLAAAGVLTNAGMDARLTRRFVKLEEDAAARLLAGQRRAALSARGHDRVLRLARTIADLDGREQIAASDIDEALGYRVNVPALVAA